MISGSEVAFFSIDLPKYKNKKIKNLKKQQKIIYILENKVKIFLASILIGNNLVNIIVILLSTSLANKLIDLEQNYILAFIIQVILISSLILLFGEILPKIYATHKPEIAALKLVSFIEIIINIFYPFSILLVKSGFFIEKYISKKGYNISMDELTQALDITETDNSSEQDKKILRGIVEFGETEVKEIMTPRMDVVAIDFNTPFTDLLNNVISSGFSRIPVYKNSFDNVIGILYIKDLLPFAKSDISFNFNWKQLIRRPAFFIPENKKINNLLKEFQKKKVHLAVVVDEYGGSSGIVTLEDVIEEIVGEINDEFDIDEPVYSILDKNNYVFEGKTPINYFIKILQLENNYFEEIKGEADTLAGLILEINGKIPLKNETISWQNFLFKIEAADNRSIKRIKVTMIEDNDSKNID